MAKANDDPMIWRLTGIAFVFFLTALTALVPGTVRGAQNGGFAQKAANDPGESVLPQGEAPVRLNADEIIQDKEKNLVIARGNVEVMQGERILLADRIVLNQETETVSAEGHVTLLEPSGETIFADYVKLSDELKNGLIKRLRIRLTDNSRMAANKAIKKDERTEMTRAVFSPCNLCKKDPERPPLWQIKAQRVVHDQKTRDITYHHAFLEMFGFPVLYTPYLSHPDPTVKRRSGFLVPRLENNTLLGFVAGVPYYYVIDDQTDMTIEPIYTTKQGPVIAAEYRQRFTKGELEVAGSFTQGDRIDSAGNKEKDKNRGHINAKGRLDVNRTWRMGFDVKRSTDDTYLRRYNFGHEEVLTTRVFAEGFRGRTYAGLDGYLFQDQRPNISRDQTPRILPVANYNFVSNPSKKGDYLTLDVNLMNLTRTEGVDSRRFSVKGGWHLPWTTKTGHVFDLSATLRGDIYYVSDISNANNPGQLDDETTGRLFPQAALTWRYPLIRKAKKSQQLIEPMAAIIAAPNGSNPSAIPNEDSLTFEFDDTDLFWANRFVGLDRVEGGQRIDYGLKIGTFSHKGTGSTAFFGQSFRLQQDRTFEVGSGLRDDFSDYVGNVQIRPGNLLDLLYRFRLDKDDLKPVVTEVSFSAGRPIFRANLNYLLVNQNGGSGELDERNEIAYSASSKFTPFWSVRGHSRHDLTSDGGIIAAGGSLTYEDECFSFTTALTRTFTRDRDLEPSDSISFRFLFKHLGGTQI